MNFPSVVVVANYSGTSRKLRGFFEGLFMVKTEKGFLSTVKHFYKSKTHEVCENRLKALINRFLRKFLDNKFQLMPFNFY